MRYLSSWRYDHNLNWCSAESGLTRHQGTCESYQRIYSKLLDAAGIANGRITGNGHTWNAVKIDGKWCQMDLTWDDTSDNWYGDLDQRHLYFGLTDELMAIAHSDHTANYQKDGYAYRSTDLSNNYFVRNGKADEWAEKYADRIQEHLDAKEESFSIDADNQSFPPSISGIQNGIVAYAMNQREWTEKESECDLKAIATVNVKSQSDSEWYAKFDFTAIFNVSATLPAPTSLSATAVSPAGARLEWCQVDGALGYVVLRGTGASQPSEKVGDVWGAGTLSFVDASAPAGERLSYSVVAFTRQGGTYARGKPSKAVSLRTAPAATARPTASLSGDRITVRWEPIGGADGYVVLWSRDAKSFKKVGDARGQATSSLRVSAGGGFYKVAPFVLNSSVYTRGAESESAECNPATLPAPTSLSATAVSPAGARLEWCQVDGALGYVVLRGTGASQPSEKVGDVWGAGTLSFVDASAPAGERLSYSVVAFTRQGGTYARGKPSKAVSLRADTSL